MPEFDYGDLNIEVSNHVAVVEIARPPNNFFDTQLIQDLAACFKQCETSDEVRAIVLCAQGKHFCSGNDFRKRDPKLSSLKEGEPNPLYAAAADMFGVKIPVVGAIQGAAIGGGFGLSLGPDFRVVSNETRMSANFVKLGFYPGFGLTATLPRLIGEQNAAMLLMTGRRIDGVTAKNMGLADVLAEQDEIRDAAIELATELAQNAPLSVEAVKGTLRGDLSELVRKQTVEENAHQARLQKTEDFKEGIRAVGERRPGNFIRA